MKPLKNHIQLFRILILILALGYAGLLLLFASDVFTQPSITLQEIVGFLIHAIPSFMVIICGLIGFMWPLWGSIVFVLITIFFIAFFGRQSEFVATALIYGVPGLLALFHFILWTINKSDKGV